MLDNGTVLFLANSIYTYSLYTLFLLVC